jgi:hypothetical protein
MEDKSMYITRVKLKTRSLRPNKRCHKVHSEYLRLLVYPKHKLLIEGNKRYGTLCSGVLERNLEILHSLSKNAI